MFLLDNKGKMEVGNVERQLLRVEDTQHINLLRNLLTATISFLLWGGKAGLRWSEAKLKEIGEFSNKNT